MATNPFAFDPITGLKDTTAFPTTPVSEAAARKQFQDICDQLKDYINNTLLPLAQAGGVEDLGVTTAKLANLAVTAGKIADNAIETAKIKDLNVTTNKIQDDAINGSKIADDSIDSAHYVNGSIDREHLAADVIDGTKIADNAVNSEHVAPGHVVGALFKKTAKQTINNETETALTWNSYTYNPDNSHDGSYANRMVCRYAGVYTVDCNATFSSAATGTYILKIRKNGSDLVYERKNLTANALYVVLHAHMDCVELAVNDYIEAEVEQITGGSESVTFLTGMTYLSMRRNPF